MPIFCALDHLPFAGFDSQCNYLCHSQHTSSCFHDTRSDHHLTAFTEGNDKSSSGGNPESYHALQESQNKVLMTLAQNPATEEHRLATLTQDQQKMDAKFPNADLIKNLDESKNPLGVYQVKAINAEGGNLKVQPYIKPQVPKSHIEKITQAGHTGTGGHRQHVQILTEKLLGSTKPEPIHVPHGLHYHKQVQMSTDPTHTAPPPKTTPIAINQNKFHTAQGAKYVTSHGGVQLQKASDRPTWQFLQNTDDALWRLNSIRSFLEKDHRELLHDPNSSDLKGQASLLHRVALQMAKDLQKVGKVLDLENSIGNEIKFDDETLSAVEEYQD